jgi:hypothetical protein
LRGARLCTGGSAAEQVARGFGSSRCCDLPVRLGICGTVHRRRIPHFGRNGTSLWRRIGLRDWSSRLLLLLGWTGHAAFEIEILEFAGAYGIALGRRRRILRHRRRQRGRSERNEKEPERVQPQSFGRFDDWPRLMAARGRMFKRFAHF